MKSLLNILTKSCYVYIFVLLVLASKAHTSCNAKGDYNGDCIIDLKEAIHALKVVSGLQSQVSIDEIEPNNSFETATIISLGINHHGKINYGGDEDFFKFSTFKTGVINILIENNVSSELTLKALLYNAYESPLFDRSKQIISGETESIKYPCSNSDFFYLNIKSLFSSAVSDKSYTIYIVIDPSVSQEFSIQLNEDTRFTGILNGSDVDSTSLSFSIITFPQKGSIQLLNQETGKFIYIPNANVSGNDNFTYQVSDGIQHSEIAKVTVLITPVNDIPILESQNLEIEQDQHAHITLIAEDADKDTLTYKIMKAPDYGMASIDGAGLTYAPVDRFLGVDTLTVYAYDGKVNSKLATIQIWVGIHQVDVIGVEDESIPIDLPEQASIVQIPNKGVISKIEDHYVYRPNANESGYDSFCYKATPGANSVSMTVFIKPVNDRPSIIAQDTLMMNEDQVSKVHIEISDPETSSDQLIMSVTDAPDHGKIEWIGEFIEYQPFADYNGSDSFTIRVSDGFENSYVSKTIQVTITPLNDTPRPIAQSISMFEDKSTEIKLTATDLENDSITYAVYETTTHGKITGTPPNLIYTPIQDYFGKDYLLFTASDGKGTSQPQAITIVILGTQDRPVAYDSTLEVPENVVQVTGQLLANDPDNDLLIYSIVTQPGKGNANITKPSQGTFIYRPNPGASGEDMLTFHVGDNYETSNLGLVTIQIAESTLIYHQLYMALMGDYLDGDSYGYSIVNLKTNAIVKQDQVDTKLIYLYLPENEYVFQFSGKKYQPSIFTFNLMADMVLPISIENNPDVFRLNIELQGDYMAGEAVTVRILDANSEKVLKTIETTESLIATRLIAGVYKFSVQGDNYLYMSSVIYLDKDRTIQAALISQSNTQ